MQPSSGGLGGTRFTYCVFAVIVLVVLIPYSVLHQKHLDDLRNKHDNKTYSNSTIRNRIMQAVTRLDHWL